jgi:hypothetical protein
MMPSGEVNGEAWLLLLNRGLNRPNLWDHNE